MFNAQEIIELEAKWKKYKRKKNSKIYFFIIFLVAIVSTISYKIYMDMQVKHTLKTPSVSIAKKEEKKVEIVKKDIIPVIETKKELNSSTDIVVMPTIENNSTAENNDTNISSYDINKTIIELPIKVSKKDLKPYYFKLEPTEQGSELFSSNGYLTLNLPFQEISNEIPTKEKIKSTKSIRKIQEILPKDEANKKKKIKISISMKDVDSIEYLKNKYYSTSNIVFALMIAEEYYFKKEYKNALQWALTANDLDSQNTKSWYWFAKAKVKLGQVEDAKKALKAYLAQNHSKRLMRLLNKIENGDYDD